MACCGTLVHSLFCLSEWLVFFQPLYSSQTHNQVIHIYLNVVVNNLYLSFSSAPLHFLPPPEHHVAFSQKLTCSFLLQEDGEVSTTEHGCKSLK